MDTTHPARRSRSFPTLSLLFAPFRWIGGSRKRIGAAVMLLLAMIACPVIWWWTQLLGLPDIGHPFDVAAFKAMRIPDDRNAFVLYRQAAGLLKPRGQGEQQGGSGSPVVACESGGTKVGRGQPRGDGGVSPGDRAARCTQSGPRTRA